VDLGITGRDQVAEHEAISPSTEHTGVEEVLDLGFGKCSLKVQVPEKGEISDSKDLIGKNVVTSFVGLTRQYFARLEKEDDEKTMRKEEGKAANEGRKLEPRLPNGTSSTGELRTKIKYVGGSVEAACALGVADGIVDLVG
jgi:ATP phosphoribosyltransferase